MGSKAIIRCIRLWTGDDHHSHFEEGGIALHPGSRSDLVSGAFPATRVSFQETPPGGTLDWHTAPVRQLVITLSGTLDFQVHGGQRFQLSPRTVLLAEDTTGSGHIWKLLGDEPWRRVYVVLGHDIVLPFIPMRKA
jgi:hypothetical protein